jgi:hypothetical protein
MSDAAAFSPRPIRSLPAVRGRGARLALAVPVLVALVASGCGGSSKPAVCDKRDAVKSSVDALLNVSASDGVAGVTSKLEAVQSSVKGLASAAGTQYQPQISALQSSVAALSAQVQALGTSPSVAALTAIPASAQKVQTDFTALTDAIGSACD